MASAGLLLLTDSSDMVNQLTGPNSCEKESRSLCESMCSAVAQPLLQEYLVSDTPVPNDWSLRNLREGHPPTFISIMKGLACDRISNCATENAIVMVVVEGNLRF